MKDLERIELLLIQIYELLKDRESTREQINKNDSNILTTEQAMERFAISKSSTLELFCMKGSPAFKIGVGRGHWRVEENDFKKFLLEQSEEYKS